MSAFHAEARMARLASYRPRPYWLGTIGWIAWFVSPIGPGWLTGQLFDELQSDGVTDRFWWLLAGLTATTVGAVLLLYRAHRTYVKASNRRRASCASTWSIRNWPAVERRPHPASCQSAMSSPACATTRSMCCS